MARGKRRVSDGPSDPTPRPRGRPRKSTIAAEPIEEFRGGSQNPERLDLLPPLAARIDAARQKQKDAGSDVGNLYQKAEQDGFNRAALKEAIKLRNMEPDKRRDYLSSLNAYCDKLGIWDQRELFDDPPKPPKVDTFDEVTINNPDPETQAGYTFACGRQAGYEGQNAIDNPWPAGTKSHGSWHAGWLAGQRGIAESLSEAPAAE